MDFSKKLNFLIEITKTTNNNLSRYISLDPSYISRLRNGKRKLPKNADYVTSMALYFSKYSSDKEIWHLFKSEFTNFEEGLYLWLIDPNQESPTMNKYLNNQLYKSFQNDKDKLKNKDYINKISFFYGNKGKREAALIFLKDIIASSGSQTIYLFSDEDMDWLANDLIFFEEWKSLMWQIVKGGNKIKIIHTINRYFDEMLTAISGWMPLYVTGSIDPYYYPKKRDGIFKRTLFISQRLALVSTSVGDMGEDKPSTLVSDKKAIEGYRREYMNYLKLCNPLIQIFTEKNQLSFHKDLYNFDKATNPAVLKTKSLSILTMPEALLRKIISREFNYNYKEIAEHYKSRIISFHENLQKSSFMEIITLANKEKLLEGKIEIDLPFKSSSNYTLREYILHLENIINLLKNERNYHVYIDEAELGGDYNFYIKEEKGIMLSSLNNPQVIINFWESNITTSFWDYLDYSININKVIEKDKEKSILRLNNYLSSFDN